MSEEKFEAWAIVDLFGHTKTAGRISEFVLGGETFIRVDIPDGTEKFHTELYGKSAIYKIALVDEPIAREMASRLGSRPVHRYELGNLIEEARRIEATAAEDDYLGF